MMSQNLSRLFFLSLAIALMTFLVNNALAQSTHVAEPLASAVTITVDTTDDDLTDNGNCTLREAIQAANTNTAVDNCPAGNITTTVISLPAGTYTLTIPGNFENDNQTGDLDILSTVVISGAGQDTTVIDGNGLDRVFDVRDAGHATMSHLTITGGGNNGLNASGAGARAVDGGTIHLSHVHVTGNTAEGSGGGLTVLTGTLTIEYSQITQNVAANFGGGINNRNGTVTISDSSIVGNESGDSGGGIANQAAESDANLTITDSEVLNNVAGHNGGGIGNALATGLTATLLVERVTISGNSAAVGDNGLSGLGGGVTNNVFSGAASGAGIVTIRDSVISDNQATNGGGIGSTPATAAGPVMMQLTVENSAITGNTASGNGFQTGNGGGIAALDGTFTMINSTISGNTAAGTAGAGNVSGLGGAMLIGSQALPNNVTLVANTIANNTAVTGASGVVNASLGGAANVEFKNNLIAGNVGANCVNNGGTATSLGYNLDSGPTCTFFDQATDLTNTDPMLGALTADGDTYVHPLMDGSPAIDTGSCTDANDDPLTTDQRGVGRPQGVGCDMGAYEWVLPEITINVDSTADDLTDNGNCTLREAVEAANTKTAVDMCPAGGLTTTIMVPAGTYTLAIAGDQENNNQTGDIDILSNVILIGAGAEETILNANNLDRFFDVYDTGHAHISHLTITGGLSNDLSSGAGLRVFFAHADIDHVVLHNNVADTPDTDFGGGGGGVYFYYSAGSLNHSEVRNNEAYSVGGGVYVRNGTVVISQTLIQENSTQVSSGGGVSHAAGESDSSLIIVDSQIISNTSGANAGGVGNVINTDHNATLLIERTLISGNSAALDNDVSTGAGGGVGNGVFVGTSSGTASMTIRDSVIRQNTATNGAGISSTPAGAVGFVTTALTVENSFIADNTAVGNAVQTGNGGGILALDGSLTVINSTISGNTAAGTGGAPVLSGVGGGIVVGSQVLPNNATLVANTIVDNTAVTGASGLANVNVGAGSAVTAKNNILADNVGANCVNQGGTITSLGYNLDSGPTCAPFFNQATDLTETDPMLGPLTADGDTYVYPLMASSPAIDAGSCTDADGDPILFDQRGMSRPQGATCDIGAYEFEGTASTPDISVNPTSLGVTLVLGETATETLTILNDGDLGTDFELLETLPATVIMDGSFEAGTPNPHWDEASTNYGSPLCTIAVCNTGGGTAGPRTGDWWAWFGGSSGPLEIGSLAQDVVIPTGSAMLSFYLWIGTTGGSTTDYFAVEIDGNEIFRVTEADQPAYSSYTAVALDVTAYADGGTHTITFLSETESPSSVNFSLDDVVLESSMDVPWLSVNPVTGTVGANSSTTADILFDTSVLTETGSFTATLQLVTDDPNSPLAIPVFLTVTAPTEPIYGVALDAATTAITDTAGLTVTYAITVENTGNMTDTFDIMLDGASWTSASSMPTLTLGAGEMASFDVTVAIPAEASDGDSDSVMVTATSQMDNSMSASVTLTTTAVVESVEPPTYTIFLPLITR